ncbi:MAG: ABC transporter ATP-binding protein [Proteobacteria bacterium]|nr:ABC transporter ATP-binding protein [Pseudomonadota bacterium]
MPHYKSFLLSILLMLLIATTTSLHAWLVQPALDEVFGIGGGKINFSEWLPESFSIKNSLAHKSNKEKALIIIPILVLLVTFVKGFATYFQLLITNVISLKITSEARIKLYRHFITSDISKLHNKSSGDMIASIINEINGIVGLINSCINGFVKQFFTLAALVFIMFQQSVELSLVAFIGFPLAAYPIYKIGRKMRNLSFKNQEMSAKFTSQMSDTLQYSKLVKAYHCEEFEINRMSKIIDAIFKMSKKITRLSLISSPFVESLAGFGVAAVIWYGGMQVVNGQTTPGAFFSFFTAMMMAYRPLKSISGMNSGIQLGLAAATRFYQTIDEKPTIVNKPNAFHLENTIGNIEFCDVNFSYQNNQETINNLNFSIKAGQSVALVGHSGGGKSTIMNLLLRFYDPQLGKITLDGHNIADLTLASLRSSMSVVNQEVMLFDDTVLENIRYGKTSATEEQIIEAAKMAEADEFIANLPEKYQTKVGQNGIRLSGGQRQRIAIARAILYNAPILLLDEATSSLDPISEKLIKDALKTLMKGKTSVIIAHRLSTIMHCDKIIVIQNGRAVEEGNHSELLAKNGFYANLYYKQFSVTHED